MKRLSGIFMTALLLAVTVSGCKKDKEEPEGNYLLVEGKSYPIETNLNFCYPPGELETAIELNFVGPDIDLTPDELGNPSWAGTDVTMCFGLFSSTSATVDSGTYPYFNENKVFTFNYGDYCLNYDREITNTFFLITEGTITVKVDGEIYDFTFEGKDEQGKSVKMHYNGEFTYKIRNAK